MPLTTFGYKTELLYRVREEVLGTTFYWQAQSGTNFSNAVPNLAKAFAGEFTSGADAFGSDVKFDCVKASALGFGGFGWSYEESMYVLGSAFSVAIDEMLHTNVTIQSEFDEDTQKTLVNRNQVAGIPVSDVTDGRISTDVETYWLNKLTTWAAGISNGGFTFLLACGRRQLGNWEFITAERFKISPFPGTRIDRVKNRPNTGRKMATTNGPDPP